MSAVPITVAATIADDLSASLDAGELKRALARLKPAVLKSGPSPFQCARLDTTTTGLELTTSDLDLRLTVRLPADVDAPGVVLVPFATLDKVAGAAGKGATLAITAADGTVTLRAGAVRVSTPQPAPVNEFPAAPPSADAVFVKLDLAAIAEVLPAAATDGARPQLCGVHVDGADYVATDSYRLRLCTSGHDAGATFMLPASAASLLAKLGTGSAAGLLLDNGRFLAVTEGDATVCTRLFDMDCPPYRALIPGDGYPVLAEIGDDFAPALAELVKVAGAIGADLGTDPVRLTPAVDGIRLAITADGSTVEREVGGRLHVDTVAYTARYLANHIEGLGAVTLYGTALKLTDVQAGPRRRLLMPVRT